MLSSTVEEGQKVVPDIFRSDLDELINCVDVVNKGLHLFGLDLSPCVIHLNQWRGGDPKNHRSGPCRPLLHVDLGHYRRHQ